MRVVRLWHTLSREVVAVPFLEVEVSQSGLVEGVQPKLFYDCTILDPIKGTKHLLLQCKSQLLKSTDLIYCVHPMVL